MIGKLVGIVEHIDEDHFLLNVDGVVYIVFGHVGTLSTLQVGQKSSVYTDLHIKDEQIVLYGFLQTIEKKWFKLLQTVQGVGSKVALLILGSVSPEKLTGAILSGDQHLFKQIPGIGSKIASRIINELKDKFTNSKNSELFLSHSALQHGNAATSTKAQDAVVALSNLGFNRTNAYKIVTDILASDQDIPLENLIKEALGQLGSL
ncbi:Holliday junction branch migration protein RuvA [Rickettsiales endosymbiont of Peranema trichophorum]|uniref:Holliday junction branch migration protein RuvA n=1 Tax=Rickettsiales endosymbiont of Peranema trichophorum TaxID=2486577 RepID=UPI00102348E0|nr:Holliday junction branch migration protein RuvA [Rickettsiales endosymbiont of Peranema trichophorum]RZI47688.1 Holliday junction branch migration protein RuvA [Rickettsiales endosymbiont of Peranema trichophorum]